MADDVGSMLLRAGLVAPEQVEAARIAARENGGTVPEHLVQQGHIADEKLTAFYRTRLLIPRVNPSDLAKLRGRLLGKVPSDMATEFRAIPVALDGEGNLTLVMSDPSDTSAVDEIGFFTGNYVVRAVATQAQIAWCLAHYYKQKTKLYLGLVAQGEWPTPPNSDTASSQITQEVPQQAHPDEGETGPMSVRNPRAIGRKNPNRKARKSTEPGSEPNQETRPTKRQSLERPSNQQPSPPELFARAGEIRAAEPERDFSVAEEAPAVVISISPDASAVPEIDNSQHDTAPILLTAIRKKTNRKASDTIPESRPPAVADADTPILLSKKRRPKRRSSKTDAGVGAVGKDPGVVSGSFISPKPSRAETAPLENPIATMVEVSKKKKKKKKSSNPVAHIAARVEDLVGGDWGEPGTTIPPGYLGPVDIDESEADPAAPVEVIEDEASTTRIRVPDSAAPTASDPVSDLTPKTEAPVEVRRTIATDAASLLLDAVRSIDHSNNRELIVDALLTYLDVAFERSGFLAVRQDDLISWRLHGCPDGAVTTIDISKDSTFQDAVRTRLPYNGPLEDPITKQVASDLDIPDALDLLVLPIALRDRAIGVFFGLSSFDTINADHINVLVQAATEAFERIVLSRKK